VGKEVVLFCKANGERFYYRKVSAPNFFWFPHPLFVLDPIPNLSTYSLGPGVRGMISVVVPFDLLRKKGSNTAKGKYLNTNPLNRYSNHMSFTSWCQRDKFRCHCIRSRKEIDSKGAKR
jgi:hypothetical protein